MTNVAILSPPAGTADDAETAGAGTHGTGDGPGRETSRFSPAGDVTGHYLVGDGVGKIVAVAQPDGCQWQPDPQWALINIILLAAIAARAQIGDPAQSLRLEPRQWRQLERDGGTEHHLAAGSPQPER